MSSNRVQRVQDEEGWLLSMRAHRRADAVLERHVTISTESERSCWYRVDEFQRLRLLPSAGVITF